MATDYSKWDYFTDSESEPEEEKDPIVPEHDPAFQALKWDIDKRNFARKEKKGEAIKLKERANKYFAIQDYKSAITYYSQAIDEDRGYLVAYTNRALCYIKLG